MSESQNCVERMLRVTEMLAQDLNELQAQEIQTHIDECSDCLSYWGIEEEIQVLMKKSCASPAPVYLRARVKAKLVLLQRQMQEGTVTD